ncbi:MAG: hypothetical protein JSV05_05890 [Candidatus Bathyarchaeota archaeon]|nr:MAG: hypothetical protein JSV05_05890 [Candidatus Bathyarchaeota archaeon]
MSDKHVGRAFLQQSIAVFINIKIRDCIEDNFLGHPTTLSIPILLKEHEGVDL